MAFGRRKSDLGNYIVTVKVADIMVILVSQFALFGSWWSKSLITAFCLFELQQHLEFGSNSRDSNGQFSWID
jgi:phage FluMu gp28-like protein